MNLFTGLEWWQIIIGILVGLFLLMILVLIHELGHAIVAKRNGVVVEEFGLGLPPRAKILGKVKGTLVTLNWLLPLGGFCKMRGESDADKRKGSFGAASFAAKTKILFAGVSVNLIAAMVIFTVLAWIGLPVVDSSQFALPVDNYGNAGTVAIAEIFRDSPASASGLRIGDEIREISQISKHNSATIKVNTTSDLSSATQRFAGQRVEIKFSRNNQTDIVSAQLNSRNSTHGILGIEMEQKTSPTIRATWSAPLVGIIDTLQFVWMTVVGLIGLIGNLIGGVAGLIFGASGASSEIGAASASVAGPVGIFAILSQGLFAGPTQLLFIMGIISLTLTVMNILPIPAFDGGRWYLIAWYKLRHKELTEESESRAVGVGVIIIMGIFILATLSDVLKLF